MTNQTESNQELNATQLDAQRARNLLDRALGLAERDDVAGAIIVCRQSLVLAPKSSQGWSMLGLLHERGGDINGAIEAYEKALQLSPSSTLERESLQRLRKKRGMAPRPAPKFSFDKISGDEPQVPANPIVQSSVPQPIVTEPIPVELVYAEPGKSLWDTFYFRSLPVLVVAVVCLGLILLAQRVAANRQVDIAQSMPAVPMSANINTDAPSQSVPPALTPGALAPPAAPAPQPTEASSSESVAPTSDQGAPAPVIAPPSKPKAASKPRPKPKPKASVPSTMPVLPRPRLTLPKRTAPAPAVPRNSANDSNQGGNAPTIDGGPVDVGSSQNDRYIPISPPPFPSADRNQR